MTEPTELKKFTIDNNVYNVEDLSSEAKYCINQISDIDRKIRQTDFDKAQLVAGRTTFSVNLGKHIENVTPIETLEAPETSEEVTPA